MEIRHTDGNDPLEDQRRALRSHETFGHRLVSFMSADPDEQGNPRNVAEFDEQENPLPDLVFLEVLDPGLLNQVRAEQQARGRTLIFSSDIFVSGRTRFVAGFRDNPAN